MPVDPQAALQPFFAGRRRARSDRHAFAHAAGEKAARQTRPGEERQPGRAVPGQIGRPPLPGNAHAARPGFVELVRQREIRAARHEGPQPLRRRVFVGFLEARRRPIRAAIGANPPRFRVLVQAFHQRPHRLAGVVAVQQIQIHLIRLQARQAIAQIRRDVAGRDPLPLRAVVRPLGEDHQLRAVATRLQPAPHLALVGAIAVDMRRIQHAAAPFVDLVQQPEGRRVVPGFDDLGALRQARERLVDPRQARVLHTPVLHG